MITHSIKTLVSLICLALLLTACSSNEKKEFSENSETAFYENAVKASKSGNYSTAVELLEELESRYPFGRYSEQAQLEMIFAQYKSADYEAARAASSRFIRLHPQHAKLDYVYYLKGLAAYQQDKSFIDRFLNIERSQRDMGAARESLVDFGILLNRYPDSQYVDEARARMIHLRNMLADHEIHVGRYYLKRNAYIAAANRGRYVVENYPTAPSVPDGLAIMVQAYQQLGLTELAEESQQILSSNAPNYKGLGEQANFSIKKGEIKTKRSWLNRLSFGMFGDDGKVN
ncbi:MAG: outer membrane protein assembly factor BamD [Pseudomonadales bacterium]